MGAKKILFLFFCLCGANTSINAQMALQKFYNFCTDPLVLNSNNGVQFADSGFFIAAGNTESPGITTLNTYLATFDYNLNLLNKKELYFSGQYNQPEGPNTIIKMGTNKYLLAANQIDDQINSRIAVYQPYFFFFDQNLDSLGYIKYVDTIKSRWPSSLIQDKQKNIIVTGVISSDTLIYSTWFQQWNWEFFHVWLAKYDSNANLIWEKTFLNPNIAGSTSIVLSHDSTSYILSAFDFANNGSNNNIIIKTDTAGNILWQNQLPNTNPSYCFNLIATQDGNYAFLGTCSDSLVSGIPYYLYFYYGKINENGDTLWTKKFIKDRIYASQGSQLCEASNGDLLLLGTRDSAYDRNALLRTDKDGNIEWYREYMYDTTFVNVQNLVNLSYLANGQILLSGDLNSNGIDSETYDSTGNSFMSWFVLTDTFGCIIPGCNQGDSVWQLAITNVIPAKIDIKVYPNPTTGAFNLRSSEAGKLIFFDMVGKNNSPI